MFPEGGEGGEARLDHELVCLDEVTPGRSKKRKAELLSPTPPTLFS